MPITREQIDENIDDNISNVTTEDGITPVIDGENRKLMLDYVDGKVNFLVGYYVSSTVFNDLNISPYIASAQNVYFDLNTSNLYRWNGSAYVGFGSSTQITKTIKVHLSSADILSLFSSPKEILPAVTGKIYIPRFIFQDYTYVSTNYAYSGNVRLAYNNANNWVSQFGLFMPNFNSGQSLFTIIMNTNTQGATYSGKSLLLTAITSDPTGGDGTSNFYLTYDEITL